VGGPINVWFDNSHDEVLGSVVPETPPPQEVLVAVRETPVHDDEQHEAGYVVDLMVRHDDIPPPYCRTPSAEL